MSNKSTRRRTRQSLGQVPRSSQRFKNKTYLSEHEQLYRRKTVVPLAAIERLLYENSRRIFYRASPEILQCFRDYPERYRKIKAFTNSLWAHGPKSKDVRRPFLRGLSAVNGRWAVARPTGNTVTRFDDHVRAQAYIIQANRRLRKWFNRREWYYLLDMGA